MPSRSRQPAAGPGLVLELPYLPPAEFSRNSRAHWSKLHRVQDSVADDVLALLLEAGWRQECPWKAARLTLTFFLPDKRVRDGDNLITAAKPILDALKGKVFEDDSLACIGMPEYRWEYRPRQPGTQITIQQQPAASP